MNTVHIVGNFLIETAIVCGIMMLVAILIIELVTRVIHYAEDKWDL